MRTSTKKRMSNMPAHYGNEMMKSKDKKMAKKSGKKMAMKKMTMKKMGKKK